MSSLYRGVSRKEKPRRHHGLTQQKRQEIKEAFEDGIEEESESGDELNDGNKDVEMEELEKQYTELRSQEQDILKNLKRDKSEDAIKGIAVKIKEAFELFDTDGSGTIDAKELNVAMR